MNTSLTRYKADYY